MATAIILLIQQICSFPRQSKSCCRTTRLHIDQELSSQRKLYPSVQQKISYLPIYWISKQSNSITSIFCFKAYPSLNAILNSSLFCCSRFYAYPESIQLHLFLYEIMDICFELSQHFSVLLLNMQYCQMTFNSANVEKYLYRNVSIHFLLLP